MPVIVVPYSEEWSSQFKAVAADLHGALSRVPVVSVEHVGSTSVPGLVAKPILDIDVIVQREHVAPAIRALADAGYVHRGDLGVAGREAFRAPAGGPARNVYVCVEGTLHLRNHLAVRSVLRSHPDLRDAYGEVKLALAGDPAMTTERYVAGKSAILQTVLDRSELSTDEKLAILQLNSDMAPGR
ncbi:GrpB family protein [Rhodococcus sp. BL-253-APC-6A1W]|uniref:GrpB family protein n=1 Tax=Rhodococcus TaxID=1827 RepID=UPI00146AF523|nr:GrpB family protein [Rhodococcus sp. BL-253-APC-6A1W]